MPRDRASGLQPGEIETELGIPLPGAILPPDQWARTALKKLPPPGPLDWTNLFGRAAPLVLDLGCGNGRFVVADAVRRPACNHLGLDILPLVIRYATRRANQRGLHHVRFAVCGACEFLEQYVAPASVAEIHLYHPQPYHDPQFAAKRLITPEFLALAHRALLPHGMLIVQTDHPDYWRYIASIAGHWFEWTEQSGPWPDDPAGRTRREIQARRQGLRIFRGQGRARTDVTDETSQRLLAELPQPSFTADTARGAGRPSGRRRGQRPRRPQHRRRRGPRPDFPGPS